jgi:hypothetical protein
VSAATDVAFRFGDPVQEVIDINLQAGPDGGRAGRLLVYSALHYHHRAVPVRTILILLWPAADHSRLTGKLTYQAGDSSVEFKYEVIRLWQQPLEAFLTGGLGLLPLAPLCQMELDIPLEDALKQVVHRIDERLIGEAPKGRVEEIRRVTKRFGPPGQTVAAALLALDDIDRLERIAEALIAVASWQELLATS